MALFSPCQLICEWRGCVKEYPFLAMPRQITGLDNIWLGMTVLWKVSAIAIFTSKSHEDAVKESIYNYHSILLWHIVSDIQNESWIERWIKKKISFFFNDLRKTKENYNTFWGILKTVVSISVRIWHGKSHLM